MPVVVIGASAGGLEATSRLFDVLPPASGMSFIVVHHLDPNHESLLSELLAAHTSMSVVEASDGCSLMPDHVYVIPPGHYLSVRGGALWLSLPTAQTKTRLPLDHLLASMAVACGSQTICVVLSGMGGDGSASLTALKLAGGFTIAQKPEEADFGDMPRSAIATGLVDRICSIADMPQALVDLISHKSLGPWFGEATKIAKGDVAGILALLKERTAHDFQQYKPGTIERRIERRMGLLAIRAGDLASYKVLLAKEPGECELLARDLLINVTSFFRDPRVFEYLQTTIIPGLIEKLAFGDPLRIWVAGCSSGEEAYSIGMICRDVIADAGRDIRLQVFASDLDSDAIVAAREGLYPLDIDRHVSAERLGRFFIKEKGGYRVAALLRGDVVFTVQNLLSDPPFSRIDLVSCRNLLIYLNAEAQAKVISLLHFSLREGGTLLLGTSETIPRSETRFVQLAKAERCYRREGNGRAGDRALPFSFGEQQSLPVIGSKALPAVRQGGLAHICRQAVLALHAPAAVLINRRHECLFSMGPTSRFLRIASGYASLDLLTMASPALRTKLRAAIDRASKTDPHVDGGRASINVDGGLIWFRIDVQCLVDHDEELLLVCFIEESPSQTKGKSGHQAEITRIAELERELEATQGELQTSLQNRDLASQEQKAIHEEALSVNEEFQSTNEELLTSKEELQSLNEELTALNGQLQETLDRQRLASDDLQNVLYSTNVGTMFLDADLKIRFFTPAISAMFRLIPYDVGRPLSDLRPIADDPNLIADANRVLSEQKAIDCELLAPDGTWFQRRIFPYLAHDNRVEGVVITFVDITERKAITSALEASKLEAERATLAKTRFLAAASHDLRQPLQALNLLKGLLEQAMDGDRAIGLLGRFERTLRAMSEMLDAMLDINQIEAGVVTPCQTAFSLSDMLERLRDEFTEVAQMRDLTLRIMPSSAIVFSDPRLLEQMVRNLLGNAIKYTPQGKILLTCRRRGKAVRIEVWDTGIGIEADQLHAIFEEFHQVDNAARDSSLGLGLGLSIVQRLCHLLHYAVDVRSVRDKGSVFRITVPGSDQGAFVAQVLGQTAAAEDISFSEPAVPKVHTPPAAPDDDDMAVQRCKIVVVDDDPDVLSLLTQILEAEGYIVRAAMDGPRALKLISGGAIRPEMLLTDYNLPNGMNGLGLLAKVRAMLKQPLPAIVLTGDISAQAMGRIAREDCIRLSKPISPQVLIQAIEDLAPRALVHRIDDPDKTGASLPVIFVVADAVGVRRSVRQLLESYGRRVEDFADAESFLAAYRPGAEGCLLVDARMPTMSGLDLLGVLRARHDHVPVIVMTSDGDIGFAVKAMRAGASDFLEKPVARADLLACIGRATGQSHDSRITDAAHAKASACVAGLTRRQREVMDLVLAGHPSKNIAADLGISQRTVENHRAEVMHRMGAKSIPELARMVVAAEG